MIPLSLRDFGCIQLQLNNPSDQMIVERGFKSAVEAMDFMKENKGSMNGTDCKPIPLLTKTDDAQHATGYHPANSASLSRYNIHREGFVFSDSNLFDTNIDDSIFSFRDDMIAMRGILHKLAINAWHMLEEEVMEYMVNKNEKHDISNEEFECFRSQFFAKDESEQDMEKHSQWHIKRYDYHDKSNCTIHGELDTQSEEKERLLLGSHTDPSLLSVVIHDNPNNSIGCRGLEILDNENSIDSLKKWIELPQHGHKVYTVLIGGAMARLLSEGKFKPCLHRVNAKGAGMKGQWFNSSIDAPRVVATYFLRPSPKTILSPINLSYDAISQNSRSGFKSKLPRSKRPISFHDWCARTSKNYSKSKR